MIHRYLSSLAQPYRIFCLLSLLMGIAYLIVTPPYRAPDETSHYVRIIAYAEGALWNKYKTRQVYFDFVVTGNQFRPYSTGKAPHYNMEVLNSIWQVGKNQPYDALIPAQTNGPTVDLYSPAAYLPAIITTKLLDLFHAPPVVIFYGMRLSLLLSATLILAWVIKSLPYAQWAVTAIMLWPMAVWGRAMITADSMTMAYALALIVIIIRLKIVRPYQHLFFVLLLGMAVTLSKIVYGALLLILLLPAYWKKLPSIRHKLLLGAIFAICAIAGVGWNIAAKQTLQDALAREPILASNPAIQVESLMQQPSKIVDVLYNTLSDSSFWSGLVLRGAVGVLGELDIPLPIWICWICVLFAGLLAFIRREHETVPAPSVRVLSAIMFMATLVMTLLALYVQWTPVNNASVLGFQGRYILPVIPLLIISILPPRQLRLHPAVPYFILGLSSAANFYAINELIKVNYP